MKKYRNIVSFCIFLIFIMHQTNMSNIVTHSNLVRILKYDKAKSENKNYILKSAKNEYEGFHITIQSDGNQLDSIEIVFSDIVNIDGDTIAKSNLLIYREHYLNIDTLSHLSTAPKGYYPDALIPFINPLNNQVINSAKYIANNYSIDKADSNINQSYYFELYTPKSVKAGDYNTLITIKAKNETIAQVNLTIHIWDFTLPDETPFRSCFGLSGNTYKNYFGGGQSERFKTANLEFEKSMRQHRIFPDYPLKAGEYYSNSGVTDSAAFTNYLKYYIDTLFVNSFKLPLYTNWPPYNINTDDTLNLIKYINSFYNCFKSIGRENLLYTYIVDEPSKRDYLKINMIEGGAYIKITETAISVCYNSGVVILNWDLRYTAYNTLDKIKDSLIATGLFTVSDVLYSCPKGTHSYKSLIKRDSLDISTNTNNAIIQFNEYELVRQFASIVHSANPNLKFLCTESPETDTPKWGYLIGSVDIWCPLFSYWNNQLLKERLDAGEEIWCYTALCQPGKIGLSPYWQTDYPLLNYRITSWVSYFMKSVGVLYWESTYWGQCENPWEQPITYQNSDEIYYNGEGSLFYPGVEAGFDGPVTSLRLKALRDGIEDNIYFKIADSLGLHDFAYDQIKSLAQFWNSWIDSPDSLELIRDTIAIEIEKALKTKSVLTPDLSKSLTISPNPAQSYIIIKSEYQNQSPYILKIYNAIGNLVYIDESYLGTKIDISNFPLGIYYLKVMYNSKPILMKFLKI